MTVESNYTAFAGERMVVSGDLETMLAAVKTHTAASPNESVLIFEDQTGRQVDFDLRGEVSDIAQQVRDAQKPAGPGRPKLGVISREVSLLPRHWDWLEAQPNGVSAALRRLVDDARKREPGGQTARAARDATNRFLWSLAGNLPNFEETTRALYAADRSAFTRLIADWPPDIQRHAAHLAGPSFADKA